MMEIKTNYGISTSPRGNVAPPAGGTGSVTDLDVSRSVKDRKTKRTTTP